MATKEADGQHHARKLAIKYRKVETLKPYLNNARVHSDAQVKQIVRSIEEYGWTNPILIDGKNGIIAGHGRLAAALMMELDSVPVIELSSMSDAQKRAYIIADNKLVEESGWDKVWLIGELQSLGDLDFDLTLTGFDPAELTTLLGEPYLPTLEPTVDTSEVTEDQVDKAAEKLETQFYTDDDSFNILCPKCGHEYIVRV